MSTYNFIQLAMCSKLVLISKTVLILIIITGSISMTFYICQLFAIASSFAIYYKDGWLIYKQLSGSLFIRIWSWSNNI